MLEPRTSGGVTASRWSLLLLAVAALAWATTTLESWPGYLGMNPAAGAVAALADATLRGEAPGVGRPSTFLRALYFPPVPLAAAAVRSTGLSWRAALRIVSVTSAILLCVAVGWCIRNLSGSGTGIAAAGALLLTSFTFDAAARSGRADALAAAFTLAAVAAWVCDRRLLGWSVPVWCGLALMTKATAFAVPLAIVLALGRAGAWRDLLRFGSRLLAALAAGVLVLIPVHGPAWYGDVIRTMLIRPPNPPVLLRGPAELLRYVGSFAELAALAALAIAALGTREPKWVPLRWTTGVSLVVALLVLSNRHSDHNHLLELTALAAVGAGLFVCRAAEARGEDPTARSTGRWVLALCVVVVLAGSWRNLNSVHRASRRVETHRATVLELLREAPGEVLTEDPLLSLEAGRPAAVSDPAVLRSSAMRHDPDAERVIRDLERGRWSVLVLGSALEPGIPDWYRDYHFGADAARAIQRAYRFEGKADDYYVHRLRK